MVKPIPKEYFLLCLIYPLTELFPNLCLGWWAPPNMDIATHRKRRIVRVILQLISFFPIPWATIPLIESENTSLLVIGIVAAFVVRFFLLDVQLEHIEKEPLWKANVEPTRRTVLLSAFLARKPEEITSFKTAVERYVGLSTKILASTFCGIGLIVHGALPDEKWRAFLALAAILLGGRGVDSMRYTNPMGDFLFRFVLAAGFIFMIYLLSEADEVVSAAHWKREFGVVQ